MPSNAEIAHFSSAFPYLSKPIHCLTTSSSVNKRKSNFTIHVTTQPIKRQSLIQVREGLVVPTPELALLQLANTESKLSVLHYAFAFCGGFALSGCSKDDLTNSATLTSVTALAKAARKFNGLHGAPKLRSLLPYVLNDSRSPQESLLAMVLTLPHYLGGFNLKAPKLNYRIDPGKRALQLGFSNYYVADLCWPEKRLIVEYDSNYAHLSPEQKTYDEARRNSLEYANYKLISVTSQQLSSITAMNAIAKEIARHLDQRIRPRVKDFNEKQRTLFNSKVF